MMTLPPEEIVTMTLLGGDWPCLICGKPLDRDWHTMCQKCGRKTNTDPQYVRAFINYRDDPVERPYWFRRVKQFGRNHMESSYEVFKR